MSLRRSIVLIGMLSLFLALFGGDVLACKGRKFPEQFPLHEVSAHQHFYLVRVDKVEYEGERERHAPPLSFEATVLSSFKGGAKKGHVIQGRTGNEEAHAVCPVDLQEGQIYLLMMTEESMPYIVSRHSLRVDAAHERFEEYLRQVDAAYSRR